MFRGLILFVLLILSVPAQAKQMVLIQGYLSSPASWSESGIFQLLEKNKWHYAGEYNLASDGVRLFHSVSIAPGNNAFYLVSLPTESSLHIQAYYLKAYLRHLRQRFPDERIILVGHSAGGVLARYVMVQTPDLNINQLITIASPHLGTENAALGKLLGDTPMALLTPLIGAGTINRSQGLYQDLLPEKPGEFIYWLNRQPHPEAEYISIVRDQTSESSGDLVVEQNSQYLEHVYDLRDRAYSYIVPLSHDLNVDDGHLILDLIEERVLKRL
jgi:triacylglycerol lipase